MPGGVRHVPRSESKLILNNTDETLILIDTSGQTIHSVEYAVSTKDVPIVFATYTPPDCTIQTTVTEELSPENLPTGEALTGTGLAVSSSG